MSYTISRLEAAKRQIDGAVRSYFSDELVVALILAGAVERVLSDLQPNGIFAVDAASLRSVINATRGPQHQRKILDQLRFGYDQLRHADRYQHRDIEINELTIELFIYLAIRACHRLTGETTDEAKIYNAWFCLKYTDIFKEDSEMRRARMKLGPLPQGLTKQGFYEMAIQAMVDESQSR